MSRPAPPVIGPERVRRPGPSALLAVAGSFGLLMLAAAMQGTPQFAPTGARSTSPPPEDVVLPAPTATETPLPPESWGDSVLAQVLGVVFGLVLGLAVLVLVAVVVRQVVRFLVRLWRDRPLARRDAAAAGPGTSTAPPETIPDAVTIRRGVSDALRTVIERPEPGDAIVAAWIGLEESAADAGQGRAPTETPAEFTARVIGARHGIAADVVVLQGLYERVRYGGLVADEDDRRSAANALRGIKEGWR
ncbi:MULTISPECIES: DUF4129 domain-containing protein [Microbacterium]|uniref:DUF4129 domain-containing protein n=1 Tax=Microbacterium TaxID=33882 RepID=UPI0013582F84|nr:MULTISPECIES: DUF4129 domain-containing protein [Microbacterium]